MIYFYPKDDTPGCTTEAIDFTNFKKKFEKLNVKILGVSKDSIKKHHKFTQKHNLAIELVSDEEMEKFVKCLVFGLKNPCMEKNTWELKGQLFFLTRISVLLISGKK